VITIVGNGMGEYNFSNIKDIDFSSFDKVICDKNFTEKLPNILKLGFKDAKEYLLQNYKKQNLLYVVTGSPLFFSAGILLASKIPKEYLKIINNSSCKTYMQERLFIDDNDITAISLHGRDTIDLTKFLTNRYTLVLCDKYSIEKLQKAIKYLSSNDIEVIIGYKLGYDDEVIEQIDIFNSLNKKFDIQNYPFVILIKKLYTQPNKISQDEEFCTERGMITKKYKRELSLQKLDLKENEILWDIGAGSGSCGIQAFKRYKTQVIFFEKQPQRIEYIKQNLINHKVLNCTLFEGEAQDIFKTIEQNPHKIFIGGGGEKVINKLPYLYERLQDNGIQLLNAITLKHLNLMINILNQFNINYEVDTLSITTFKGKLDLIEPQRQLFSIMINKFT